MFVIDCLGPKPELRIAEFLGRQLPLPKQAVQAQQLKRASWQQVSPLHPLRARARRTTRQWNQARDPRRMKT